MWLTFTWEPGVALLVSVDNNVLDMPMVWFQIRHLHMFISGFHVEESLHSNLKHPLLYLSACHSPSGASRNLWESIAHNTAYKKWEAVIGLSNHDVVQQGQLINSKYFNNIFNTKHCTIIKLYLGPDLRRTKWKGTRNIVGRKMRGNSVLCSLRITSLVIWLTRLLSTGWRTTWTTQ